MTLAPIGKETIIRENVMVADIIQRQMTQELREFQKKVTRSSSDYQPMGLGKHFDRLI